MLGLLPAIAGCSSLENVFLPSPLQSNRPTESAPLSQSDKNAFEKEWMGKTTSDVEHKFGRPTQMETLEDTGGKRYYYSESGQPHYVFEFTPNGKVTAASPMD